MNNEVESKAVNFFAMGVRELIGGIGTQEGNAGRLLAAFFFFALAFIFSGAEAIKVLFRKDFAKDTVGLFQIVLAGLAFIGWAVWCLYPAAFDAGDLSKFGSALSLKAAGVFYGLLGLAVLILGFSEWNKSHNNGGTDLGKSTILARLRKDGWSEYKIKQIAEPATLLSVGIFFLGINIFLGAPLLFCGISVIGFNLISFKQKVESAPLTATRGGKIKDDEDKYAR